MTPGSGRSERDRALFDRIATAYERKDLLPASRRARRQRQVQTLRHVPASADGHVLELGCGAGFGVDYLAGRFASYTGIDYSAQLVEAARRWHAADPRVRFETADAGQYRPDRSFDLVFMIGVLHHVEDMAATLGHARELLAPGGWLVMNEPQPGNPLVRMLRRLRKRVDSSYSEEQRQLSAGELERLLAAAGFVEVRVRAQGLLSTPFAEVALPLQPLASAASAVACGLDRVLEGLPQPLLARLSWNLVAAGRRPPA